MKEMKPQEDNLEMFESAPKDFNKTICKIVFDYLTIYYFRNLVIKKFHL